jgi:hypothetical protein
LDKPRIVPHALRPDPGPLRDRDRGRALTAVLLLQTHLEFAASVAVEEVVVDLLGRQHAAAVARELRVDQRLAQRLRERAAATRDRAVLRGLEAAGAGQQVLAVAERRLRDVRVAAPLSPNAPA